MGEGGSGFGFLGGASEGDGGASTSVDERGGALVDAWVAGSAIGLLDLHSAPPPAPGADRHNSSSGANAHSPGAGAAAAPPSIFDANGVLNFTGSRSKESTAVGGRGSPDRAPAPLPLSSGYDPFKALVG